MWNLFVAEINVSRVDYWSFARSFCGFLPMLQPMDLESCSLEWLFHQGKIESVDCSHWERWCKKSNLNISDCMQNSNNSNRFVLSVLFVLSICCVGSILLHRCFSLLDFMWWDSLAHSSIGVSFSPSWSCMASTALKRID